MEAFQKKYSDRNIFVNNEDNIIIFKKENCVHYKNIDRGIECTAKNCPCDLFEQKS